MKSFFLLFCEYSNLILNYSDLLFYTESSQLDCLLQKQSYKQSSELHPALFVSKIFILFFFLVISVAVSTAVVGRLSAVYDEAIDGLERVRL
jgi:hypothetical protein